MSAPKAGYAPPRSETSGIVPNGVLPEPDGASVVPTPKAASNCCAQAVLLEKESKIRTATTLSFLTRRPPRDHLDAGVALRVAASRAVGFFRVTARQGQR